MKPPRFLKTSPNPGGIATLTQILALMPGFLIAPAVCRADIIGHESFQYTGSTTAGADGGTFWDYKSDSLPASHTAQASDWDPAPGLSGVSAFSNGTLYTNNSGLIREYGGPNGAGESAGAIHGGSLAKQVYYRIRMTRGTGADWCGLSSFDFAAERLFFGLFPDNSGKFAIYDQTSYSPLVLSTTSVTIGREYTLVAKVDFRLARVSLFVDPDFSREETANTPVCTAAYTGTYWSSALRVASGGDGLVAWNDLTVATSWSNLRTFPVTSTADSGPGTLRQALTDAKANGGGRVTIAPSPSPRRIQLETGALTSAANLTVIIDGPETGAGVILDTGRSSRMFLVGFDDSLAVRNLTFLNGGVGLSSAPIDGAAVQSDGYFSAERCTFDNNYSRGRGGAVFAPRGRLRFNRCTFTRNTAQDGGALAIGTATATLLHGTIAGNRAIGTDSANQGGGGISNENGSITLTGCVVAGNTSVTPNGPDFWNSNVATASNCVIGNSAQSGITATASNGNAVGTSAAPLAARLAGLGDYGGTTPTMPPLPDSPAIDRARTYAGYGDQRGFGINNFPDAGAADFRGHTDMERFLATDWDRDGIPYAVEQATGTDPFIPNPGPLSISKNAVGEPVITFPRDLTGAYRTRWLLEASTDLLTWTTIWSYDAVTNVETTAPGHLANPWPYIPSPGGGIPAITGTGRAITDVLPNPARNFYRLQAQFIP